VREISDALSFSSAAYFTRVFRRQTGMTPTQFRQMQAVG
jgi:AraC-like DNA-binding protein